MDEPICRCTHPQSAHSRNFCWADGCEERHPFQPAPQELLVRLIPPALIPHPLLES